MAAPKKLATKLPQKAKPAKASSPAVELPDELVEETFGIDDYGILIYGETGIGKSSLPSHAEKPFYFRFEQSSRSLKVLKSPVLTDWAQALQYVDAAEKNIKGFKTMVVDTGTPAYDRCLEHVCSRLGIMHPGTQKDYGASWKEVQKEFQKFFNRVASLDVGVWVLAHDTIVENETRSGQKYNTIQPNFGGKTMEFFKSTMDIIGYYFYVESTRYLLIRGNEHIMAKCNLEDSFLTPSGKRVVAVPMGNSSKEAYNNLIKAFENKQQETYEHLLVKGGSNEAKPAVKKKPVKKTPNKK